jgi:hypothetical protein
MNIYPNGSVLLQIGISALVIVVLYGLHRLMEGFEKEDRQRLMRQRYARRWTDEQWMATLKILSDGRFASPFTVGSDWNNSLPGSDLMQMSTLVDQAQDVYSRMLDRSEYSIVGEPAFQRIPVGIALGEDKLR